MDIKPNKHRINILLWFLKRPNLYRQLLRELKSFVRRKQHPSLEKSVEAEDWCKENFISVESAFEKIYPNYSYLDIETKYHSQIAEAQEIVDSKNFDWGGRGNISLNYNLVQAINAEFVLETGVAYGWSTLSILLSLENLGRGSLVSVDMPFLGIKNENDIGCVVPDYLRQKWNLIRYPDKEGIPMAIKMKRQFDFCHYDSDKSYEGKIWAFPVIWKSIKSGGILASDDISDNLGFKHFCDRQNIKPLIIKTFDTKVEKYVGIAVKP